DLEMPSPGLDSARELAAAVLEGRLAEDDLDSCVDRLLEAVLTVKGERKTFRTFDQETHHLLARRAAAESAVLLKNQEKLLPLKAGTKVAVIGDFAVEPRYQGAGSSMVNPIQVETMERVIGDSQLSVVGISRGYERNGDPDDILKKEAVDLAENAEVVIYCLGLNELGEAEGLDRSHMRIPQNQIDLLETLAKVNENIVGVISAGASIEMPWERNCRAILHGYLSGQAGASAMVDILTGEVNPSGRLSETYPIKYEDTPSFRNFPSTERNAEYREGIYVGYRYYDTSMVRVQYPFGFGLSYTEFSYSDLQVDEDGVTFTVANDGDCGGAEVTQLYIGLPEAAIFRPYKELKGFKKVFLKAGERKKVRIPFDDKTFRYWNCRTNKWETEGGNYLIMVGACVADIRLSGRLERKGTTGELPYDREQLPSYYSGLIQQVGEREFETLLGHPVPDGKWSGELGINDAICQMYYAKSRLARLAYRCLTKRKKKSEDKGKPDLNILFIYNMPFRGIAKMTGGMVSMEMVNGIVEMVNGHFFTGLKVVIAGYIRNSTANKREEARLR
ncbi:glycoside hydrolase family 3 C-terminal domain-containing protein, partial [Hungatella hathewayi]